MSTKTRPWAHIRAQRIDTPEQEASVAERRAEPVAADRTLTRLADLRAGRGSQAAVGERMGVSQSGISKLEAQDDLYLSTLAR